MSEGGPPTRRARKVAESVEPGDDLRAALTQAAASARRDDDGDPERLPTAQLEMAAFGDHVIPYVPPAPPTPPSLAPWALGVSILALGAALFTGWLLPLGALAAIIAIVSLRREYDSRRVAVWALALALSSVAFSAGWLIWGFSQLAVV